MSYMRHSNECFNKLITLDFETVLDVGCGDGDHTRAFNKYGKRVTSTDWIGRFPGVVQGDYNKLHFAEHDCIWCSHVLEHQLNVYSFLRKLNKDLKEGGWLAITVPPRKDEIVGGHVTLWNTGLLIYNLVLAGFDCSEAKIKMHEYNCSVIVSKRTFLMPNLVFDNGDIETLKPWMPPFFEQNVNGLIHEWNWK